MDFYNQPIQIRWSDLDPNFHLRHSVYYDYGAFCRISYLNEQGLTPGIMQQLHIGPILFREECVFRKEIRLGDTLKIDLQLISSSPNYSRWSIKHNILKDHEIVAAVLTVDGAWIDVNRRKLATPPEQVFAVFDAMPKDSSFGWTK